MANNYDNSAWFYDRLSRLIYGRAIINAQVYLLDHIPPEVNILIVGGGTGWILEELTKKHPAGLKITYVEVSSRMMVLSRKRHIGNNEVDFKNDAIENITLQPNYDAVITPFLFDNFSEQTLNKVFSHIHQNLKPDGLWLNADFQLTGRWWQKLMLKTMLLFFKILCGIESSKLPDIEKCFGQYSYRVIDQKPFFGEFILSKAFKKQS